MRPRLITSFLLIITIIWTLTSEANALPDLTFVGSKPLTVSPSTVPAGGSITLGSVTASNQGITAAGPFTIGVYLSTDGVITATDRLVKSQAVMGMPGSSTYRWPGGSSTIPSNTPPASYYVGVLLDSTNKVTETNENNNYIRTAKTIEVTPASFTITATAGPNGSISPSGSVQVLYGADQSFMVTPNLGYRVDKITIDGSSAGRIGSYTFENVSADHTIMASFVPAGPPMTLHVNPSQTIQRVIDAALDGDTVVVRDGTYTGQGNRWLDFGGKAITVTSENGPDNCIIDLQDSAPAFTFHSGETFTSILQGFTIERGTRSQGGAISCSGSSPAIRNCIFRNNVATYDVGAVGGGAISCSYADPIITNCTFIGNSAKCGGAIFNTHASPTITNCIFSRNEAFVGGAICNDRWTTPTIVNSTFFDNRADYAGAISNGSYSYGPSTIINCTFHGNQAHREAGAIRIGSIGSSANIVNCILWGNNSPSWTEIQDTGGNATVTYSNIDQDDYADTNNNIRKNPDFSDSSTGDLRLLGSSPCVDVGTEITSLYSDIRGSLRPIDGDNDGFTSFDMGAYEYSGYYSGSADGVVKAFANVGANASFIAVGYPNYKILWEDNNPPFPMNDRRITQAKQYEVQLALMSDDGRRIDLTRASITDDQGWGVHEVPFTFDESYVGEWYVLVELVQDPRQFEVSETSITISTVQARDTFIGEPIEGPPFVDQQDLVEPTVEPAGQTFWHDATKTLYATGPVGVAIVTWKVSPDTVVDVAVWNLVWPADPSSYQLHVSASARVDLLDPGAYIAASLASSDAEGDVAGGMFSASDAGYSLLQLSASADPADPPIFLVVKSVQWRDIVVEGGAKNIGQEILAAASHDGTCGDPMALNPTSPYCAAPNYHEAENHSGPIIPVNEDRPSTTDDDMVIVGYIKDADGICWPRWPVRYELVWPSNPDKIIIASRKGTGLIQTVDYGEFSKLYYQNDPYQPGFNPNDEHAFEAENAIFALRNDLKTDETSQPYVLMTYLDPNEGDRPKIKVWQVVVDGQDSGGKDHDFHYHNDQDDANQPAYDAGKIIPPPWPSVLGHKESSEPGLTEGSHGVSGPYWEDRNRDFWAKAAGDDGSDTAITMRWFYPNKKAAYGFWFPDNFPPPVGDSLNDGHVDGEAVALLDRRPGGNPDTPIDVVYDFRWPLDLPVLQIGRTLVDEVRDYADRTLTGVLGKESVEIIYQQAEALGNPPSVKLIDPTRPRLVNFWEVPEYQLEELPADIRTGSFGGKRTFVDLPPDLQMRLFYIPGDQPRLEFRGEYVQFTEGDNALLPNVMTLEEKAKILAQSADPNWPFLVDALYQKSGQAIEVERVDTGWDSLALSTAWADWADVNNEQGYVTYALNNRSNANGADPDSAPDIRIIRIKDAFYTGELMRIQPPGGFDSRLTLRQKLDFCGTTGDYEFEWAYQGAPSGAAPDTPDDGGSGWTVLGPPEAGAVEYTIGESPSEPSGLVLGDNWIICRYRLVNPTSVEYPQPAPDGWSLWTRPNLAAGWAKRVILGHGLYDQIVPGGIDGAEQKFSQFHDSPVDTMANMIQQAGPRWEGDVPLNASFFDDPETKPGLIALYQTVLNRAMSLSVDAIGATVGKQEIDNALLFAAGRLADLYMLLGNEAYADAQDPTLAIGLDTTGHTYLVQGTSIHAFMGMTPTLLSEELALLRGRDPEHYPEPGIDLRPYYNRLPWNLSGAIPDAEAAYVLNYAIEDINNSGGIDEIDGARFFPQGHGDAWGHYLTALKNYYLLLRHPNVVWRPTDEAVPLGGSQVTVGMLHERKFAKTAAAKARTGAEIVNLTYRDKYLEDPSGQWQGYTDDDAQRAWGLAEWGSRAGQGAYFDWVVANALLPPEAVGKVGMAKVDRQTVGELREVAGAIEEIQAQVDKADQGLNPLGLAKNFIPFDISPQELTQGRSHFEQIYDRAVGAMTNAIAVFNHANEATQLLRKQIDDVDKLQNLVEEREADFNNRLIEIFGYPYWEDILGPDAAYDSDYDGPDYLHFDYVDPVELLGINDPGEIKEYSVEFTIYDVEKFELDDSGPEPVSIGGLESTPKIVKFHLSTAGYGHVKPSGWSSRRAPGELQIARSELIQANFRFQRAIQDYDDLMTRIEEQTALIEAQYDLNAAEINILISGQNHQEVLNQLIAESRKRQLEFRTNGRMATILANAYAEFLPKLVGMATDALSAPRGALHLAGALINEIMTHEADLESLAELDHQQAKEMAQSTQNIELTSLRTEFAIEQQLLQLAQMVRQEATLRLEIYTMQETVRQAAGRYQAALARGERLLEERMRFRIHTAADIQEYRYRDMAFRVFRNDALQKYRAQYDLAAMYVYMAAAAYDYETAFLVGDPAQPGGTFMSNILRARTLGTFQNGVPIEAGPQTADPGLAHPLARLYNNFQQLKSSLGLNNIITREREFSLRKERYRIQPDAGGSETWKEVLERNIRSNLMDIPEFRRYAKATGYGEIEPGIVLEFETAVVPLENLFGLYPKVAGEQSYNADFFAHKIQALGVWFSNYDSLSMILDPLVYLIPVGMDVLRSPTPNTEDARRSWKILEQKLPFPSLSIGDWINDRQWIPMHSMLFNEQLTDIRKYNAFEASHYSLTGGNKVWTDTRLVGRSVWNLRWMLVIPGRELLPGQPLEGIRRFIQGDGFSQGVTDIRLHFETYSHRGY